MGSNSICLIPVGNNFGNLGSQITKTFYRQFWWLFFVAISVGQSKIFEKCNHLFSRQQVIMILSFPTDIQIMPHWLKYLIIESDNCTHSGIKHLGTWFQWIDSSCNDFYLLRTACPTSWTGVSPHRQLQNKIFDSMDGMEMKHIVHWHHTQKCRWKQ